MSNPEEFAQFPKSYLSLFHFSEFKFTSFRNRTALTHCAGNTTLIVFMKQIGWFWLILYTSLRLCTAQHSGESVLHLKSPLFFSLSLSFLMGSKMEDRMLSKSGKQMILCFLQIWHLANFVGEISFFPLPVFEVCIYWQEPEKILTVLI